jgi:hypothetical protein
VVGFERYGIFFDDPYWGEQANFAYLNEMYRVPFSESRELVPLYEQALADENIDTSTRLYWDETNADSLAELKRVDAPWLEATRATAHTQVNGYGYRLALLA